jgi:hypothetical protein
MKRKRILQWVLSLSILLSVFTAEHAVLADTFLVEVISSAKDSAWHSGNRDTAVQGSTKERGEPLLMFGQKVEKASSAPARIESKQLMPDVQKREPERLPSDKVTTVQDACDKYAKDSVLQNQENQKMGCGFSGPRWSSDYSYFSSWCMSGHISETKYENTERQKALAGCKTNKCDQYAKLALYHYDRNLQFSCGYNGPQWNASYSYHYNWCMQGDNVQSADGQTKTRSEVIAPCSGCWSYAGDAVMQNTDNINKGCGFVGPQWNSSQSYHFKWCMSGHNLNFAKDETAKREYALKNKCGSSSPPPPPKPAPSPAPPPPQTNTTIINGFKQVPYAGKIYYMAKIQIPNGILVSIKNPNAGLGKQWIILVIPSGGSSQDCGTPGKTTDIYPGASTTKLQNLSLTNLTLGFCLSTTDNFTLSQGLPPSWALELTYKQ